MSDSLGVDLIERNEELIARHKEIKKKYTPGAKYAREWGKINLQNIKIAEEIAETITSANILPAPLNSQDVPTLVSLSSNVGINEKALAKKLGNSYKVIAGDIANVKRVTSGARPMQLDASFLPFRPDSISAIIDLQGAIWHEAYEDLIKGYNTKTEAKNLLDIFARLRPSLREGGIIIVDDPGSFPEIVIGTGSGKIDHLLEVTGEKIAGFEVSTIGEGARRLRVYKKVS